VLLERAWGQLMPAASEAEWRAFEELLSLPDPLLAGYFLGGGTPSERALAQLVERIRALCRSAGPCGAILRPVTLQASMLNFHKESQSILGEARRPSVGE